MHRATTWANRRALGFESEGEVNAISKYVDAFELNKHECLRNKSSTYICSLFLCFFNREKALANGSEFVSEGILFAVVIAASAWEYKSSSDKAHALKREAAAKEVSGRT